MPNAYVIVLFELGPIMLTVSTDAKDAAFVRFDALGSNLASFARLETCNVYSRKKKRL